MADGKNIEIRINATGGDKAAGEVRKMEQALGLVIETEEERLRKRQMFMNATEAEVAEVNRLTESTKKLAQAQAEAAVPMARLQQQMDAASAPVAKFRQGVTETKANIGGLGGAFTQVGYQVTDFTTQVSMGTSAMTAFAQQAPQAIGAFQSLKAGSLSMAGAMTTNVGAMLPFSLMVTELAIGIPLFTKAAKDAEKAVNAEAAAGNRMADMHRELATALEWGAEAYWAAGHAAERLLEITKESTEAIKEQQEAIQSRNRVLDAEADAYKATADRNDATRIRNGENEQTVKIDRANADEAAALRKIQREEDAKKAGLTNASNAVIEAEGLVVATKVSRDSTPELVAKAEENLKALKERQEKMEREASEFSRIAASRRTEVRERTAGTIEGLADERERKAREAREREQQERMQEQQSRSREALERRRSEAEAGLGGMAEKASHRFTDAAGHVSGGLSRSLAGIGHQLSNGTNEQELARIREEFAKASQGMGGATIEAMRNMIAAMNDQSQQIKSLQGQINGLARRDKMR